MSSDFKYKCSQRNFSVFLHCFCDELVAYQASLQLVTSQNHDLFFSKTILFYVHIAKSLEEIKISLPELQTTFPWYYN